MPTNSQTNANLFPATPAFNIAHQYNVEGSPSALTYDAAHQITKLNQQNAGGAFANSQYSYDVNGNRNNQQRIDGTAESYGYDATEQLTAATYNNQAIGQPNRTVNYTYDAVGNRQQVADNGNNTAYTANPLNQYTLVGGSSLAYDANGNLTGGNGWTYAYDAQNRITSAQRAGINMSFAYDPLNRCVKRTLNGTSTYLCYAGWNLIEEHNGSGTLNATYLHGASTDEILTKTDANGTVYYHHDALGNVTHLTNTNGNLIEQYRYDAFGSPTFLDAQNNILANSAYGNRFLFTGREWLQDIKLYDYRNRIYSPELGRFLQTDPIRFEARDVNIYRYVSNNPGNATDSLGLYESVHTGIGPWWYNWVPANWYGCTLTKESEDNCMVNCHYFCMRFGYPGTTKNIIRRVPKLWGCASTTITW